MFRTSPLALLLMVVVCYGFNPKIDSLKTELSSSRTTKSTIKLYRDLGKEHYKSQTQFDSAFYYAKKAYDLAKAEGLLLQEAQALFDQAAIYRAIGDLESALKLYKLCLITSKQKIESDPSVARLLTATTNNIGDIYLGRKEFTSAATYFNEVLALSVKFDFKDIEAISYLNLGEISFYEGKYKASEASFAKAKKTAPEFIGMLPPYYFAMARTFEAQDRNIEAIEAGALGMDIAQKEGDLKAIQDLALLMAKAFKKEKDYKSANEYKDIALEYKDSLNSSKNDKELERVILSHQLKEQEGKLKSLALENKYLTTIYVMAALGILLLFILILRQLKIVKMTRSIHTIQNDLIKTELELRKTTPKTSFQATRVGDKAS